MLIAFANSWLSEGLQICNSDNNQISVYLTQRQFCIWGHSLHLVCHNFPPNVECYCLEEVYSFLCLKIQITLMGGLEDAAEYHISCLCPEGVLAMTSPLPVFSDIAESVSLLTSQNQNFLGTWRSGHACQVQTRRLVLC